MPNRPTSLILLAVLVAGGLFLLPADKATGEGQEMASGEELFVATHKCNMCHAVEAAGIEAKTKSKAMLGSDLSGKVEGEFEEIAAYVRKEADLDGKSHKKPFKGTDEELQAILDWLASLEKTE